MKLLFDESIPGRIKQDLIDFEVSTVSEMGWAGKSNGDL